MFIARHRALALMLSAASFCSSAALAAPPTAEEINRVMDHFNNGKDAGPVLLELTPCLKVDKKPGEDRKSCVEPVAGPVPRKSVLNVWMRWFVPKGQKYDGMDVQFVHGGEVRETKDLTIDVDTGSTNYGVYKASTLSKPGEWEVRIRVKGTVVGTAKVTVAE
jgi:hypothetical protein